MALDRWIALVFIAFCCVYGYAAFFTMDQLLPPFMQRNPVWPSTFPKILAVLGVIVGLIVLFGLEQPAEAKEKSATDINIANLREYKLGQAGLLLLAMVLYALALRPFGFLLATTLFLTGGALVLGERKLHILIPVALIAAGAVWYLVEEVLGIFLRPLPGFL
ncbi:MAG: tripartite tricarboxylate transporter TctB family protein [Pseudomonadota bacterium]